MLEATQLERPACRCASQAVPEAMPNVSKIKRGAGLALIAVVALFGKTIDSWLIHKELNSKLLALSNSVNATSNISTDVGISSTTHTELRRLQNLSSFYSAIREAEADESARLLSDSLNVDYRLRSLRGDLSTAALTTPQTPTVRDNVRSSLDDIITRAKSASIDITTSQTARTLSGTDSETMTISVKGTYPDIRSWLIEVTDADPQLLLTSAQFRRESRTQGRVTAEIKFVRVEDVVAR